MFMSYSAHDGQCYFSADGFEFDWIDLDPSDCIWLIPGTEDLT
jgi:hypothetical protein